MDLQVVEIGREAVGPELLAAPGHSPEEARSLVTGEIGAACLPEVLDYALELRPAVEGQSLASPAISVARAEGISSSGSTKSTARACGAFLMRTK